MKNKNPRQKKLAAGWFLGRASGLLLVLLLAVHFTVIHFERGGQEKIPGRSAGFHGAVFLRLSHPLWWVFYAVFLSAALYHGFYGLRGIAAEYIRRERLLASIRAGLLAASIALWAAGMLILVNSQLLLANPPALCYKCHARGSIPSCRAIRFFGFGAINKK